LNPAPGILCYSSAHSIVRLVPIGVFRQVWLSNRSYRILEMLLAWRTDCTMYISGAMPFCRYLVRVGDEINIRVASLSFDVGRYQERLECKGR
jgi:hypothetical protein